MDKTHISSPQPKETLAVSRNRLSAKTQAELATIDLTPSRRNGNGAPDHEPPKRRRPGRQIGGGILPDAGPLAIRLRRARKTLGFPLREMAQRTGLSVSYLNQLETGRARNPGEKVLPALSRGYEIPLEELTLNGNVAVDRTFAVETVSGPAVLPRQSSADDELHAMMRAADALESLDPAACKRAWRWLADRFGPEQE